MSDPISVRLLQSQFAELQRENDTLRKKGDTGGGNPPGGNDMERRIEKLEQAIPEIQIRLVKLDSRMDNIERQMVTKADLQEMSANLQKALNDQTWKFIGLAGVLAGLSFTAAKLIS